MSSPRGGSMGASGPSGEGSGARPLPKVEYAFSSKGDESTTWRVVRLRGDEGVSELYEWVLDLANEDLGADPDAMLGKGCELTLTRESNARRVCGIVRRVEHQGSTAGHQLARVFVVPAMWGMGQRRDSFIFQEQTVPQIVSVVLSEG